MGAYKHPVKLANFTPVGLYAMQGRLDALEQRMLSKMDRALAKFLDKQLGMLLTYATQLHVTCVQ